MTANIEQVEPQSAQSELEAFFQGTRNAKYTRFVFAALGAIPWIGAFFAAGAALSAEKEQGRVNELNRRWMEEHAQKISELSATLASMMRRLEQLGESVEGRLQDDVYLGLVRQGFQIWDEAGTKEKRERVRQTLTNAAGTRICSDDVVRLFLHWLRLYDDLHLRVIRVIHANPGATRAFIWEQIHGEEVREDSAEADLFKLMIRDLSTGSVIRQDRGKTPDGQFVRAQVHTHRARTQTLESAFEDSKPYVLTELGSQFVHYAMNELVPRIPSASRSAG